MNRHHQDSKKTRNADISGQISKPSKRWTLLYVGNKGRVFTLKRFKSFVLFTALLFAVSISISVFFFIRSQNIRRENKELQTSLLSLQKQVKEFRHEKEIMMARLVLAESRAAKSAGGRDQNELQLHEENTNPSTEDLHEPVSPVTAPAKAIASTRTGADSQTQRSELAPEPGKPASTTTEEISESDRTVAIEDFNASNQADNNVVQVRFKIKNTSPDSQRVSGHTIVVLKGDTVDEQKWVTIPVIGLVSGKPTGREKGYAFGISYFRNMRFQTNTPDAAQDYNTASVYVFLKTGELLLEQDFPISLHAPNALIAPQPSKEAAPASSSVDSR